MIKLETIKKLMECSILTGYLKDEQLVSLFLIGKPESGKSELIKMMRNYPNVYYVNELSYKGYLDYIIPDIENNKVTHLLIPDFVNIISHKKAAETLIPLLNSLMAEGLKDLKFFGSKKEFKVPIFCGLLTGITKEIFDKRIIYWRNIGFLTRMLVITYSYSETTKLQIHEYIRKGLSNETESISRDFSIYKSKIFEISIPNDIALNIEILANNITENNSTYVLKYHNNVNWNINLKSYGFRLHKLLRALIKGICLYNSKGERKEVNNDDLNTLREFTKFINFNFTEI